MEDTYLKYYFYKILAFDNNEDRNKFFYVAKNTDISKIKNRLIHILLYYKSFVNRNKTIKYIKLLEEEKVAFLEDILDYITSKPYCKILRYIKGDIGKITNVDMNYEDQNKFIYDNIYYTDEQLMDGIKDKELIQLEKYEIEDEFITDEYENSKYKYLLRTIFRSSVMY